MKPGHTPSGTPPAINTPTVKYTDVNSVSKSDLPRPAAPFHKPLTAKDVTSPAFIEKVVEILNGDNDKTEVIQSLPAVSSANKAPIPSLPDKSLISPLLDKAPISPIPDKALIQQKPNAAPMTSPLIGNSENPSGQVNSMFPTPSPFSDGNGGPIHPDSPLPTMPNEAPKPNIAMHPQAPISPGGGLFVFFIKFLF